jgi:hypothetical protein
MAHLAEMAAMTATKLGMKKEAVDISVGNVELIWRMTPDMVAAAKAYAERMLELKQIRALPDFTTLYGHAFLRRTVA